MAMQDGGQVLLEFHYFHGCSSLHSQLKPKNLSLILVKSQSYDQHLTMHFLEKI